MSNKGMRHDIKFDLQDRPEHIPKIKTSEAEQSGKIKRKHFCLHVETTQPMKI